MNFLAASKTILFRLSTLYGSHILKNSPVTKNKLTLIYYSNKIRENQLQNDKWRTIYHFPFIRLVSSFNKLKLYQIGLLTLGTPLTLVLENLQYIPQQSAVTFLFTGITGLMTLSIGSLISQNLIGFIYISKDEDSLKISFVDFWGRRKDCIHKIEEILNVTPAKLKFYQIVQTNDTKKPNYKLIYRFSEIIDKYYFNSIFGE